MGWPSTHGVDIVGLAYGGSHAIPPWPDQEAHQGKITGCERGSGDRFLAKVWH